MKKHIKGMLISLTTLSLMFPVALTATAAPAATKIDDPYVYENTTNNTTTQNTTSTTIVNPVAKFKDASIYAEDIEIQVGDDFDIMNDVTAYDNNGDGNELTDEVTVSGEVNTAEPGEYDITYEVTGANGETVSKDIIVTVIDPEEEEEYEEETTTGARKCDPNELSSPCSQATTASTTRPTNYTGGAQKCTPGVQGSGCR